MRFLVDAQLPPALALYIRDLGHEAEHVADLGMQSASDARVWQYAVTHSAILITKDADFVVMRAFETDGPAVVWVRIGNTTKRELLTRMSLAWPEISAALGSGEAVVEVA